MTDQTQSAVEAMARAEYATHGHDAECNSDTPWEDADPDMKAAYLKDAEINLATFLTHLTASGWQIVPVVATFGEDQMSWAGAMEIPTDVGRGEAGRMACQIYTAMLAAAPKFPGREG